LCECQIMMNCANVNVFSAPNLGAEGFDI
jgi:hypothetical protein